VEFAAYYEGAILKKIITECTVRRRKCFRAVSVRGGFPLRPPPS
jgi:hypothetical protein